MLVFIFSSHHSNHDNSEIWSHELPRAELFVDSLEQGHGFRTLFGLQVLALMHKDVQFPKVISFFNECNISEFTALVTIGVRSSTLTCRFIFDSDENRQPKDYSSVKKPSYCELRGVSKYTQSLCHLLHLVCFGLLFKHNFGLIGQNLMEFLFLKSPN